RHQTPGRLPGVGGRRGDHRRPRAAGGFGAGHGRGPAPRAQRGGPLGRDPPPDGGGRPLFIRWEKYDGVGRAVRNGLNFTERGFGVRGAVGVSDRGHTAASQLEPGDVDWDHLFGELGVRWLHTGGIFAALSESAAALVVEAVTAAKRHGTVVSYDLNYRPSLWQAQGGQERAREV